MFHIVCRVYKRRQANKQTNRKEGSVIRTGGVYYSPRMKEVMQRAPIHRHTARPGKTWCFPVLVFGWETGYQRQPAGGIPTQTQKRLVYTARREAIDPSAVWCWEEAHKAKAAACRNIFHPSIRTVQWRTRRCIDQLGSVVFYRLFCVPVDETSQRVWV